MGSLDPNIKELSTLSKLQLEAAKQLGTEVEISFVQSTDLDNQHDPSYTFSTPKNISIILNERPQREVLRSLDWYNEDDEFTPLLAYISREDNEGLNIDMIMGTKVELPYKISGSAGTKIYEVLDVKSVPPSTLMWVCKLVPVRGKFDNEVDKNVNQDSDNFDILKVDKDDSYLNL